MTEKAKKKTAGASIGWRKNTANADIRDAMKAKGIGQVLMGQLIGQDASKVNRMLKNENLAWNIREALLETIRRYDPETNPMAR